MLVQFLDIHPFFLVLPQRVFDELNSLFTPYLCVLYLRTHLYQQTLTTFFRSFMLRILKGISLVKSSQVSTPRAQMSTDSLQESELMSSGARQRGVPQKVERSSLLGLQTDHPKSHILMVSLLINGMITQVRIIFSGLISLWMMNLVCMQFRALQICPTKRETLSSGSPTLPSNLFFMRCSYTFSSVAYSQMRQMDLSSWKQPYNLVICGWLTKEWILIQRKMFSYTFRLFIFYLLSTFSEQMKPLFLQTARNTSLYVPSPILDRNKNWSGEKLLARMTQFGLSIGFRLEVDSVSECIGPSLSEAEPSSPF